MPQMIFDLPIPAYKADGTPNNVSAWLLAGFAERNPDYDGPATDIQKGKHLVKDVVKEWLEGLEVRYHRAALVRSDMVLE